MNVYRDWDRIEARLVAAVPHFTAPDPTVAGKPGRIAPLKRLFDIVLVLILLVPLSFVMAGVAIALWRVEGGPILYRARRMNAPGHEFTLFKFRTMSHDEDDYGATGGHKHWRISPMGRFLRGTRLDELPQLFNILRGDISFVGPRPPLPEYVAAFPRVYARVLQSRPGVTGLATLFYHRHEDRIMATCDSAQATEAAYYRRCLPIKLRIDMIYQEHRSMRMDLWIMWQTVKIVIWGDRPGALRAIHGRKR